MARARIALSPVGAGEYIVRFALSGFSRPELRATVTPGATVTLPVTLEVKRLAETVEVVANTIALDVGTLDPDRPASRTRR